MKDQVLRRFFDEEFPIFIIVLVLFRYFVLIKTDQEPMEHEFDPDASIPFRTYIPQQIWDEYYFALGKFMHCYGRAEGSLSATIRVFVGDRVTPRHPDGYFVVDAVLSSFRLSAAQDTIKRLLRVTKARSEVQEAAQQILSKFSEIQFLRDKIAHYGATPDMRNKDRWFSTGTTMVNEYDKMELIYFKPQMLLDMADDLHLIPDLLNYVISYDPADTLTPDSPRAMVMVGDFGFWKSNSNELKREGPKHYKAKSVASVKAAKPAKK
ncbi:hypothetical protein GTP46_13805 [Duganella sp. FT135W]|uniref:Uncharacterized protein n=1 Tax=Duganella flavida TaxID=2692175 RepID=A0A6L8K8D8_9BURK|nr:hypothetical protein [Duganella flavida]MYM23723.1 hypothetical protein [Duganella flavida]